MKTAGIRELKAKLSAYLREVERGETLLVTDRGRVIAKIEPPAPTDKAPTELERRSEEAIGRGLIRPAKISHEEFVKQWNEWIASSPPPSMTVAEVLQSLDESRKDFDEP